MGVLKLVLNSLKLDSLKLKWAPEAELIVITAEKLQERMGGSVGNEGVMKV